MRPTTDRRPRYDRSDRGRGSRRPAPGVEEVPRRGGDDDDAGRGEHQPSQLGEDDRGRDYAEYRGGGVA